MIRKALAESGCVAYLMPPDAVFCPLSRIRLYVPIQPPHIPPLPVRQWVLLVPKRLRYFLAREPAAASAVLHILLRVVEAHLRKRSPGASPRARFGAVSFVHRFGAALNRHLLPSPPSA